jgi:hypothetical protein
MDLLKIPKRFSVKNRNARFMLYTLFGLIVADGLMTQFLVTNEISGAFLVTLLLWTKYNARPKLIYSITTIFLVFYTSIVFWNLFVFVIT